MEYYWYAPFICWTSVLTVPQGEFLEMQGKSRSLSDNDSDDFYNSCYRTIPRRVGYSVPSNVEISVAKKIRISFTFNLISFVVCIISQSFRFYPGSKSSLTTRILVITWLYD